MYITSSSALLIVAGVGQTHPLSTYICTSALLHIRIHLPCMWMRRRFSCRNWPVPVRADRRPVSGSQGARERRPGAAEVRIAGSSRIGVTNERQE